MARIGVLPVARPTFDVPFAEETAAAAFAALDRAGHAVVGGRELLFDAAAAETALETLKGEALDLLLILQATFTDATHDGADRQGGAQAPLAIWAFPEPRSGGRLRLNAFCGLNLAAHTLGRASLPSAGSMPHRKRREHRRPTCDDMLAGAQRRRSGASRSRRPRPKPTPGPPERALAVLEGSRIGLVGEHPVGFDTCRYERASCGIAGLEVERVSLPILFARAAAAAARIAETSAVAGAGMTGLDMSTSRSSSEACRLPRP